MGRTKQNVKESVNGQRLHSGAMGAAASAAGLASIRTGFHYARFSEVAVLPAEGDVQTAAWPAVLFDKHLLSPPALYPGGSTQSPVERNDFNGVMGCAFTLEKAVSVVDLGRFASGRNASGTHALMLLRASTKAVLANASVDLATAVPDLNGYAWGKLHSPVALPAGERLYIVSEEVKGGDSFFGEITMVQGSPGALSGFATPVYQQEGGVWSDLGASKADNDPGFSSGHCYGPLNLMLSAAIV